MIVSGINFAMPQVVIYMYNSLDTSSTFKLSCVNPPDGTLCTRGGWFKQNRLLMLTVEVSARRVVHTRARLA